MRQLHRLLLISLTIFSLSCSREGEDDGKKAVVRLKMPNSTATFGGISTLAVNAPGGWSLTDPATLNDILCYVVAVSGPEDVMQKYTCTQVDTTVVMRPSLFGGPALPNGEIQMSVPSGSARTFYIIGFAAASVNDCLDFTLTGIPVRENLSAPQIIGTKTVDLVPGTLDLDIEISMTGAVKFNECTGPYFNPDPAVLLISDGPTYDYGDHAVGSTTDYTFTLENKGGSTATSLSEIGLASPYSIKGGTWPGTGGTCGTSLATSTTCTFVVSYDPLIVGTPTDTITVGYNDGYAAVTVTRDVQAIASAPAFLSISDGPFYDFGNTTVITLSLDKTFTVTNTGSYLATAIVGSGLAAPFSFKGGTYPGTGGTCGVSLASLATCTIVVTFNPTVAVLSADSIQFDFIDGAFPASSSRGIQGTGATPASLAISNSPTYDFGTRADGSTANFSLTVTNSGDAPATALAGTGLAAPFTFVGGAYPGTGGTCGATIVNGSPCTILINYSPVGLGLHTDTVQLDYHDGLVVQNTTRALQGTSVTPASLSISDGPTYDYGTLPTGATANYTFTITNTGAYIATAMTGSGLAAPFTFVGGTYPGTAGTCAATLAAAASCTVVVQYAPTIVGVPTDAFDIGYFDGAASQTSTANVQGTSVTPASLTISDAATYNFGTITNTLTADYTFTVTNGGGYGASGMSGSGLAAPFTFKGGSYPGTGGDCAATLAASATCTIVVTYAPTVAGAHSDTITITYFNGVSGQSSSRNVQGTGVNPALLTISDGPTYDYGTIATSTSLDYTFTVTNSGDVSATTMSGAGLVAPFTFKDGSYPGTGGTCSTSLAASGTCTIVITFAPTLVGLQSDTVDINYDDGTGAQISSGNVQGTGL